MTETERKALALVNEVRAEYPLISSEVASNMALCRAIEQHDAYRQEVSDVCSDVRMNDGLHKLDRFILPKPVDPLMEAITDTGNEWDPVDVERLRAALAARGLKIVEDKA